MNDIMSFWYRCTELSCHWKMYWARYLWMSEVLCRKGTGMSILLLLLLFMWSCFHHRKGIKKSNGLLFCCYCCWFVVSWLLLVMVHVTGGGAQCHDNWGVGLGTGYTIQHVQCDGRDFPRELPTLPHLSQASWQLLAKVGWLKATHSSI